MKISRTEEQLGSRYVKRYWLLAEKIVESVFKGNPASVRHRRRAFEKRPSLLFYHEDPFNLASVLCGLEARQITKKHLVDYRQLERQLLAEEILKFLKSRKGPVKISWVMRMVFGSHYDLTTPSVAIGDLVRTGKITWVSGDRVNCL